MLEKLITHIEQNKLIMPGQRILLAISGGLDSMVMFNLFLAGGYSIEVAHCNFQLRSEESDKDEMFVKEHCEEKGIKFHSKRFDTNNYATAYKLSIQMAARQLRFKWFHELVISEHLNCIATAHHLNDNIETLLLNFVRNGLSGQGISAKKDKLIRPLLPFTRDELEEYAASNQLIWREDSSNSSDNYQRNYVRHQIIPRLKELNPSLEETFRSSAPRYQLQRKILMDAVASVTTEYVRIENGNVIISKRIFKEFPSDEVPLLYEIIKDYGFNMSQIEDIVNGIDHTGATFKSANFELSIDRSDLIIYHHELMSNPTEIKSELDEATFGKLTMKLNPVQLSEVSFGTNVEYLDLDKLKFPLSWRQWLPGDSFYPLGMDQSKKLSDFFIDEKISIPQKQEATVLISDGQIVWVVGYRIDQRFRVSPSSLRVLSLLVDNSNQYKVS